MLAVVIQLRRAELAVADVVGRDTSARAPASITETIAAAPAVTARPARRFPAAAAGRRGRCRHRPSDDRQRGHRRSRRRRSGRRRRRRRRDQPRHLGAPGAGRPVHRADACGGARPGARPAPSISTATATSTWRWPASACSSRTTRPSAPWSLLENDGRERFTRHVVLEKVARVADVRAGDLDGDGDLDLSVAQFGYDQGETRWLENQRRLALRQPDAPDALGAHQRRDRRRGRRRRSRHRDAGEPGVGRDLRLRQRRARRLHAAADLRRQQRGLRLELDLAGRSRRRRRPRRRLQQRRRLRLRDHDRAELERPAVAGEHAAASRSPITGSPTSPGRRVRRRPISTATATSTSPSSAPTTTGRARTRRAWSGSRTTEAAFTLRDLATAPTHLVTLAVGDLDRRSPSRISSPAACT